MDSFSLNSKVALVTGASRGIGQAIAKSLAEAGAFVVGSATSAEGAAAISAALGDKGRGIKLNVTDLNDIDAAISDITQAHGAPLILVNNAGITRDNLLLRMKDAEWADVINTNLTGVFRLSQACLRGMLKARTGRIVSISSVIGSMGNAGQANYAAAKAGISGFSRAMAQEVGSRNITVNVVAPGFIDTDMTQALPEAQRTALLERIPAGRMGSPADIASLVRFLCSDAAGYITGETIHINGGLYMAA